MGKLADRARGGWTDRGVEAVTLNSEDKKVRGQHRKKGERKNRAMERIHDTTSQCSCAGACGCVSVAAPPHANEGRQRTVEQVLQTNVEEVEAAEDGGRVPAGGSGAEEAVVAGCAEVRR